MTSYFDENTPDIVLKSLFTKYDTNNSGFLNPHELSLMLTEDLGLSDLQAEVYIKLLDKNADGQCDFDEFKAWLNSGEKLQNAADQSRFYLMRRAVEYFNSFDKDSNHFLDANEIKSLVEQLNNGSTDIDKVMAALDKNSDGRISFFEFMKWLNWVDMSNF